MKHSASDLFSACRKYLDAFLLPKILWPSLLAVLLVIALVTVLAGGLGRPATLWFPKARGQGVGAELRYLPVRGDVELGVRDLVDELVLGPMDEDHAPLCEPGSDVSAVLARGKTLYVDLSSDVLFGRKASTGIWSEGQAEPALILELVRKTVSWNYPGRKLVLTIGGKEALTRTAEPEKTAPDTGAKIEQNN